MKSFVESSRHLTIGTDDTSILNKKVASYGLHDDQGNHLTIAMMNTSATCGDEISLHLMKVLDDQEPSVRDMIKEKLVGVITDRGPAAESGAKKFVKEFNRLHRVGLQPIFVMPCTMHMISNGVSYMAGELSKDAKETMSKVRRTLGDRQTGNLNKHSLCEAFKQYTGVGSPFASNLGCRFEHWPINGQNLVDFEMMLVKMLDEKKTLTPEQEQLHKLMKQDNWTEIVLECGALFVLYERLLFSFDNAVKSSSTTVGQLKIAMNELLTKMTVAEYAGLDTLIRYIDPRSDDVKDALKKLLIRFTSRTTSVDVKRRIDDFMRRAVIKLRIKVEKDFKLMNQAIDCGLDEDCIVPFHNRAAERSFSVMKAIHKKIGNLTDDNCYHVSIARQNQLHCYLSALSDTSSAILTNKARSKRVELLEKRRKRATELAREKLAAEYNFTDLDE